MTGPISEGFKIADGFLRVYTDYKDAIKQQRQFIREADDDLGDADRRRQRAATAAGRQAGRKYSEGFAAGLQRTMRALITPFLRILSGLARAIAGALAGVAKLAGLGLLIGTVAVAVGGLAAAIVELIPLIAELVNVLIAASGALLLIPGAIATLIGTVVAAKIGLQGMGEAMKAVASGDAAQLDAALKKLAPHARTVVRALAAMKPAFDRLRLRVQNNLFARMTKQIQDLGRIYLPLLETGLVRIVRVLNLVVRDFLGFLLNAQTQVDFSTILLNVSRVLGNLRSAFVPLLRILRDITAVSTAMVAQLTSGIGDVFDRWADRIAELRADGGLQEIIENGLEALRTLGGLLTDIVGIIRGLVRAAGGAGGLFSFFDRLNKLINSVEGQTALRELFADLDTIGRALIPVLGAIMKALVPVIDGIADIAIAFSPGLVVLATALGNALSLLADPIASLAPLMSSLARGLAPLAVILGELVKAAAPGLTVFLEALVDALIALTPVAPVVGKALGDLFAALAPLLEVLGPALAFLLAEVAIGLSGIAKVLGPVTALFARGLGDALRMLIPPLLEVGQRLLPVLADAGVKIAEAFAPLLPILGELVEMYLAELARHLPIVIPMFAELIRVTMLVAEAMSEQMLAALNDIMPLMPDLIKATFDLVKAMLELFLAVAPLIPPLLELATQFGKTMIETGLLKAAVYAIIVALQIFTAGLNATQRVVRFFIGLITGARDATGSFGRAVRTNIGAVMGIFSALAGTISRALGNLGGLLFNAGRSVIQGLINGVRNMLPSLSGLMNSAASIVRNVWPFSPAKTGPLAGRGDLRYAGQNIVGRLTEGVQERLGQAAATAAQLAGVFSGPAGPGLAGGMAFAGAGAGGGRQLGPYIVQIGDRKLFELVIDAVTGHPEVIAATADEGRRIRTFHNPARGG